MQHFNTPKKCPTLVQAANNTLNFALWGVLLIKDKMFNLIKCKIECAIVYKNYNNRRQDK